MKAQHCPITHRSYAELWINALAVRNHLIRLTNIIWPHTHSRRTTDMINKHSSSRSPSMIKLLGKGSVEKYARALRKSNRNYKRHSAYFRFNSDLGSVWSITRSWNTTITAITVLCSVLEILLSVEIIAKISRQAQLGLLMLFERSWSAKDSFVIVIHTRYNRQKEKHSDRYSELETQDYDVLAAVQRWKISSFRKKSVKWTLWASVWKTFLCRSSLVCCHFETERKESGNISDNIVIL